VKSEVIRIITVFYRFLFGRRIFFKFNKLLYDCSLRGLGILNYESSKVSGEESFVATCLAGKEQCVVFDVGANVGKYSSAVLRANSTAIVHAFEPHPRTYQVLVGSIRHPSFLPSNCAVGEVSGTLSLYDYLDADGSAHASLYKGVIETIHKKRSIEHKVEVISLGTYVEDKGITHIDLLKIDTEGNELNVLKGVQRYLKEGRIKVIHFEFNEMNVFSRTYFKDFWDLLPNYVFYRLLPDGPVHIESYHPVFCEIFAYQNIIAVLR
jgi:FkbM family methyltransferase